MEGVKIVAFACFLWGIQLYTAACQSCNVEDKVSGKIVAGGYLGDSKICWTIQVPLGHSVHLQMKSMASEMYCNADNVRINISGANDVYKFCKLDDYLNPITALGNVTVTHSVTYSKYDRKFTSFLLEYNIKPIECLSEKNFKCDKNSCVSKEKVCDGVRDCKNGADESGCETNECSGNNTFQCGNNYCIPAKNVCDGVKHCKNGADEVGCDTLQCETESHDSGQIVTGAFVQREEKCWRIPVKEGHFIHLHFPALHLKHSCSDDYVQINTGTGDELKFCSSMYNINNITAYGNVTVTHYVSSSYSKYSSFNLVYSIYPLETTECPVNNSFRCDSNSCIPKEKVCDGVRDCANGADEIGCETVTIPIEGVSEAREKAVFWLKQQRTAAWGWKENTNRAIIALYLASAASFNGTVLEEELMAKQNELRTAVALLRPSLTNSELSMLINALLVTCHNPRQFYGNNLVQRLKHQVEESGNFTHPLAYLTLCNANESWPLRATSDLINVLNSTSGYPFKKDLQAMAVTALSCERNSRRHIAETLYEDTIKQLKKLQHHDGSFGNVYTTALITQALLSSGQERSRDWSLNATLKYLMKELNSSSVDLLATYFVLPLLNGKSLMDISFLNCSANPRKHGDDPITDISDYVGPKMRVQYSLYIGDDKDVVHTISFRAPDGYTASKVMELAEDADSKYKFEWKMTAGKMYVYEIAGVKNDPEAGKFWLLHVGSANSSEPLKQLTNGPDEVVLQDKDHLVLWYKTATI